MNTIALVFTLGALAAGQSASAQTAVPEDFVPQALGSEWTPIDPARLMDMRGGMELPSGLMLSFGIERLVYVNGELIASATLSIPDISRMTTEQAQALADINRGMVVQVGEGNRIDAGTANGGLVIQNTLDGQTLESLTTLSVGVDTLGTLQQINAFDALHGAQINLPGGP
jgi:hypothetical protein